MSAVLRIELLRVPDCPHADMTRREAQAALRHAHLASAITERVGAYPSPTLLVDGLDVVTGLPPARGACCRLDRPSRAQIIEALGRALQRTEIRATAPGGMSQSPIAAPHGPAERSRKP